MTPLGPDAGAYVLCFVRDGQRKCNALAALTVLSALNAKGFSGRCEYYDREDAGAGEYRVGVAVGFATAAAPDAAWWASFADLAAGACAEDSDLRLLSKRGRTVHVADLRADCIESAAVEFVDGMPLRVLESPDSWFGGLCRKVMEEEQAPG